MAAVYARVTLRRRVEPRIAEYDHGRGGGLAGRIAMPRVNAFPTRYSSSLYLLAAAVCLWPVVAGAQPPNPTDSDGNGNTAAGTNALLVVTGSLNTAVGYNALANTTTSHFNTATGAFVLSANTTGSNNTASGRSSSTPPGATTSPAAPTRSSTTPPAATTSGSAIGRSTGTGSAATTSPSVTAPC